MVSTYSGLGSNAGALGEPGAAVNRTPYCLAFHSRPTTDCGKVEPAREARQLNLKNRARQKLRLAARVLLDQHKRCADSKSGFPADLTKRPVITGRRCIAPAISRLQRAMFPHGDDQP